LKKKVFRGTRGVSRRVIALERRRAIYPVWGERTLGGVELRKGRLDENLYGS